MKRIFAVALLVVGTTALASAAVTLQLVTGATTITVSDNGSGDGDSSVGYVNYINHNLGGWDVQAIVGVSNSPTLSPVGLDLHSLVAKCNAASCTSLEVLLSDTGFTQPVPAFTHIYSATDNNVGPGGFTQETAYWGSNNALFSKTGLIGTIGPFVGTGGFAATQTGGGPAGPGAYSLTLDQVFNSGGTNASFSVDGSITAVPEPATLALVGTALVLCASRLRKRIS